jgi:lysophospholipase L1-like esterase
LIGDSEPLYQSQPYLNYINFPYNKEYDINKAGLRNKKKFDIPKPENTIRILFLGGSTTFGEVKNSEDAFPALLEQKLNEYFQARNISDVKIECMNGGMGAATSAEFLIHYLLKYKYFNPDVVVIHAGINDAFTNADFEDYIYQPDYHTSKRIMMDMHSPTKSMKLLCTSYIGSYFALNYWYKHQLKSTFRTNEFFDYHQKDIWFEAGSDSMFSNNFNAFYNNVSSLINVLNSENKKTLLVSEVVSYSKMPDELSKMLKGNIEHNAKLLIALSKKQNKPIVILQKNDFPEENFIDNDGIHVNEKGEKIKTALIYDELVTLLENFHNQ